MSSSSERAPLSRDMSYTSIASVWDRDMCHSQVDTAPTSVDASSKNSPVLKGQSSVVKSVSFDDLDTILLPKIRSICFVGAGFVGGPTAAVIALHNPQITVNVVDLNVERIAAWNSPHLPVHEAGLPKIVRIGRDGTKEASMYSPTAGAPVVVPARQPNLIFSSNVEPCVADADIVFICVNTPTKMYGLGAGATADLGTLELATRSVAQHAKAGAIVVEKSTVPCGTAHMISDILCQVRPEQSFEVLSNPEFLAEGSAVKNLMNPDRVLIGSGKTAAGLRAAAALKSVYTAWVPSDRVLTVNTFSSELTKLIANAMLAQRISSINAVSALCEELEADVEEVSRALGADSRLGAKFLQSGVGFGGSCFEKDILNLSWLASSLNLHEVAKYWTGILEINQYQRERFTRTVARKLNNTLRGKKIAIFGFAFKEGTNDTRNSVAVHVIAEMAAELPQEIAVFDPGCAVDEVEDEIRRVLAQAGTADQHMPRIRVRSHWRDAVEGASAVCILTPWPQFCVSRSSAAAGSASASPVCRAAPAASLVASDPGAISPTLSSTPPARDNLHGGALGGKLMALGTGSGALSEMDIITLEKIKQSLDEAVAEDPLERLQPQPQCPAGTCKSCAAERRALECQAHEVVDWTSVARLMKQPSWVFDGRNAVEAGYLRELGFKVHSIGKGF